MTGVERTEEGGVNDQTGEETSPFTQSLAGQDPLNLV